MAQFDRPYTTFYWSTNASISILHHFRDDARYWSKIPFFHTRRVTDKQTDEQTDGRTDILRRRSENRMILQLLI